MKLNWIVRLFSLRQNRSLSLPCFGDPTVPSSPHYTNLIKWIIRSAPESALPSIAARRPDGRADIVVRFFERPMPSDCRGIHSQSIGRSLPGARVPRVMPRVCSPTKRQTPSMIEPEGQSVFPFSVNTNSCPPASWTSKYFVRCRTCGVNRGRSANRRSFPSASSAPGKRAASLVGSVPRRVVHSGSTFLFLTIVSSVCTSCGCVKRLATTTSMSLAKIAVQVGRSIGNERVCPQLKIQQLLDVRLMKEVMSFINDNPMRQARVLPEGSQHRQQCL